MDTAEDDRLNSASASDKKPSSRFRRWGGEWVLLAVILAIAVLFRFQGLRKFSQVGGDDVEFRSHLPDHVEAFKYRLRKDGYSYPAFKAPFVAAVYLSQWDVNRKVTSFAKPFFLLELGLLHSLDNLSTKNTHEDVWKFHRWMACLGVVLVLAIFFLGRRLGGPWAGLTAAFLAAVSPWAVRYSTWGLHVTGGGLWFVLALLSATRPGKRDNFPRNVLFGALTSCGIYYSTSMIWPALFLGVFELVRRFSFALTPPRKVISQLFLLTAFLIGFLLPIVAWEAVNQVAIGYLENSAAFIWRLHSVRFIDFKEPYMTFPGRLLQTIRDNAAHTGSLPVDHLYFWRHLKDSDGWIIAGATLASTIAGLVMVSGRGRRGRVQLLRLLFVLVGVALVMNYTSGTQVARHYFSAGLIGFVLIGAMTAKLKSRLPAAVYPLVVLGLIAAFLDYRNLEGYRISRQGPYLVEQWEAENNLRGQLATMSMQQWDLWPTMEFIHDWVEFNKFVSTRPRAHIMYSDYIGIAHGSWFYHDMTQLYMAETFRRCRDIAFATDSYLSYLPMLYENEFYYWGLYRNKSPYFDPRIKVIPKLEVVRANRELSEEITAEHELFERLKQDPPVIIPAWKDYRILPYMDKMDRPSYLLHGIISGTLLLAFALFVLVRNRKIEKEVVLI